MEKKKNLAGSSGSRSVTLHCMWSNCCPLKIACDRSSFFFAFGNRKECMMREPLSILILRENHVSYQPHHFSFWNEVKGVRSHRWRCLQERISLFSHWGCICFANLISTFMPKRPDCIWILTASYRLQTDCKIITEWLQTYYNWLQTLMNINKQKK